MIREGKLRWISSAGGPLVVVQRSSLSSWTGASGEDYARAGAISDRAGVIKKGDRDVLVLWDEPLETAYYERGQGQFLIRWSYGPDDDAVLDSLGRMDISTMSIVEEASANIVDDSQFILDAAVCGEDAEELLPLALVPGRYVMRTSIYQPTAEIELIVHSLSHL